MLLANAALFLLVSLSSPSDVLTPKNVATLHAVSSAAISPDAKRVAFVKLVPREAGVDEDGGPWNELWLTDFSGSGTERPFVTGKVSVSAVEWTKDGAGIAFLAKRENDKTTSLYVIPAEGGEAKRVLALASDISAFSFSPDGKRVAAIATEPLSDARVRQAIAYAIDRQAIVKELLLGQARVAHSILPEQSWAYSPGQVYEFNPEKAKQILDEAGYKAVQ